MTELHRKDLPVSVLLSCYNGSRWLNEAIESVIGQSFGDYEFIIVDDGSTDNSPHIIQRYAKQDPRIVVITKDNTGLADSLNVGIQQARGEWIARLDADDVCEPTRLEKQLAKASKNSNLVYIGTDLKIIDAEGNVQKMHRYPEENTLLVKHICLGQKFPPHSSAMYRTDVARLIGGYRPRIRRSQDRDLWLRLSEVGELGAIDEPLIRVRKHSDQISHEESGRRQIIDSQIAMTSYWIRQYGCPDPVNGDETTFTAFRDWVAVSLERKKLFDFNAYIGRVKMNIANGIKSFPAVFMAIKHIFSNPFFLYRFFRTRLLGDTTPQKLAREWISRRKAGQGIVHGQQ